MKWYVFLVKKLGYITTDGVIKVKAKTARKAYSIARKKAEELGKIMSYTYMRYSNDGVQETNWRKLH